MKLRTIIHCFTSFLLASLLSTGCMAEQTPAYEYKVLALQEVEQAIFKQLTDAGVAEPDKTEKGKYQIKDVEKAKSQNSMPTFLNTLGQEGWELSTINENQLYIFQRTPKSKTHWEYKVLALNDINDLIIKHLKAFNAVEAIKDKPGEYKITNAEKAKSQFIMPIVLGELGSDGWQLVGVNKASLYLFTRPTEAKANK